MKLLSYLERYSATALARALRVTPSFVRQMATGERPVPPLRCVQIERATAGLVTRQELSSEWREIWPELAAMERAAGAIRAARRSSRRIGEADYRALLASILQEMPACGRRSFGKPPLFARKAVSARLQNSLHYSTVAVCRTVPFIGSHRWGMPGDGSAAMHGEAV